MKVRAVWLSAALALTGCGPTDENGDGIKDSVQTPTEITLKAPTTPTGTVSGQVLTTLLRPLEGAKVSLNIGGLTIKDGENEVPLATTTDASGNWAFRGMPAGADILVTIEKEGFASFRVITSILEEAGDSPLSNSNSIVGPVALTELNGSLKFLVTSSTGRPVKGAKAVIEATPTLTQVLWGGNYGATQGFIAVEATSDANGVLTVTGIPSPTELARISGSGSNTTNYIVTVSPVDLNEDGVADSAGQVFSFTGKSLVADPTPRVLQLPDPRTHLSSSIYLMGSNVPSLNGYDSAQDNMVKPGETINLIFNHAVQPASLLVRITDETGVQNVAATAALSSSNTLVAVTPTTPIEAGKEYNIQVHAVSADNGTIYAQVGFFFGGDANTPKTSPQAGASPAQTTAIRFVEAGAANNQLNSGENVYVYFDQPIGPFNSALPALYVYFNADLNLSGVIGDAPGERGYDGAGFQLLRADPTGDGKAIFPLRQSGYTSRYYFTYTSTTSLVIGTQVLLGFDKSSSTTGYQTVWGQPLLTRLENSLTVGQP